jgi:hypothetical protein
LADRPTSRAYCELHDLSFHRLFRSSSAAR